MPLDQISLFDGGRGPKRSGKDKQLFSVYRLAKLGLSTVVVAMFGVGKPVVRIVWDVRVARWSNLKSM